MKIYQTNKALKVFIFIKKEFYIRYYIFLTILFNLNNNSYVLFLNNFMINSIN